jgi:tRNA dimethylallyltransferase
VLAPAARGVLDATLERRFDAMLAQGFLAEVVALRARADLEPSLPALRAVGYRQLWAHLDGECDLATARTAAIRATRQLAKRQYTWLRAERDATWFDPARPDLLDALMRRIDAPWSGEEGP